jgi:plasmid stabilization system protein ParE
MKFEIVFSKRAEAQIDQLYDYLLPRVGDDAAEKYIKKILDFTQTLDRFPFRGAARTDIHPSFRIVAGLKKVVIVYAVEEVRVIIHGVFYGGQNYEDAFDDVTALSQS